MSLVSSLIILTFFLSSAAVDPVYASTDDVSYQVPEDWYSEEASSLFGGLKGKNDGPDLRTQKFINGTDRLLDTHLKAIELSASTKASTSWWLESVFFQFGISSEKSIGVLLLKGTPAVSIQWTRQPQILTKRIVRSAPREDVRSDSEWVIRSNGNLDSQIQSVLPLIYATGRVRNNSQLAGNLRDLSQRFFYLIHAHELIATPSWNLAKLRLDLSIGMNGEISLAQELGGNVRIRLEWTPTAGNSSFHLINPDSQKSAEEKKVQSEVTRLLNSLLGELTLWSSRNQIKNFELSSLRVGVGLAADLSVGISTNSADAFVHAIFEPVAFRPQNPAINKANNWANDNSRSVKLVAGEDRFKWEKYLGIPTENRKMRSRSSINQSDSLFWLKSKDLQNGLSRAAKIGSFFIARSEGLLKTSQWRVGGVKTSFDYSVSRKLAVSEVSGSVVLEAGFRPKRLERGR